MMETPTFLFLLVTMAAAALICRTAGFLAMRFVPMTPRVQAALKATPIAVMSAIIAMGAMKGGPLEWGALAVSVVVMRFTHLDVAAAFAGLAIIALGRHFGL